MFTMKLPTLLFTALAVATSVDANNHTDTTMHNNATNTNTKTTMTHHVTPVNYTDGGIQLQGFKAVPHTVDDDGIETFPQYPAVIIIPDWDGVNDYEQMRADMIAHDWGYIAFAADIYGADKQYVENMTERVELISMYRGNETLFTQRIQAAVDLVKTFPEVDPKLGIALAGYCSGGTGVLMYAMSGKNDVDAIVSFHGGLASVVGRNETYRGPAVRPEILVLSGGDDDAATDVMDLEATLDAANATWEITRYSDIEHAWTVFDDERYNEFADRRSWDRTRTFLREVFYDEPAAESNMPNATRVIAIPYDDVDGKQLQGYAALPTTEWRTPNPVVVILPDWDGVNEYEKQRATLLGQLGYVAFAADIFGEDMQEDLSMETRINQTSMYRSDVDLYVQRINAAITQAQRLPGADPENIAVIGYCFGGTGAIYLAFAGSEAVKVAVAFHGGLNELPQVNSPIASTQQLFTGSIRPYVLILSGGDDDAYGNQTTLEGALNSVDANWEISRYAGVVHGFTKWDSEDAYSVMADTRSWDSMLSIFHELMDGPYLADEAAEAEAEANGSGGSPGVDSPNGATSSSDALFSSAIVTSMVASALAVLMMMIH